MGTVTWLNGIDGISIRMTTAQGEKGKTMTTKEKILLYFRDINYVYNDCARLDALEKGLAELEEVVRCKDCVWCDEHGYCDRHEMFVENMDWYCADGERKNK